MKFRHVVTPRITGALSTKAVTEPPPAEQLTKVPAYMVLKGLNVGKNRKQRRGIVDRMAKEQREKDRAEKRSKK